MKVRIIASINLWDKRQPDPDPDIAVQRHELLHRAPTFSAGAYAASSALICSCIQSARARASAESQIAIVGIRKPSASALLMCVGMREIVVIQQWFRNRWEARLQALTGKVFLSAG